MKTARMITAVLVLAIPSLALAFTSQAGESVTVSVPASDDLYLAGNRVSVQSPVIGDLIMAGGDISNEGNISESIMAAGGNIDIGGRIGDDLRAAGGNIRIHSAITGDAIIAGGNVDIRKDATIGKDLVVMAGNIYLDGTMNGKAQIIAGKVYLNGTIAKDVRITAQEVVVASGAQIRGNLIYESTKVNPALEGIVSGTKQFIQSPIRGKTLGDIRGKALGILLSYILLKIIFLTVFGWLLYAFMEKYIHEASDILKTSPWISLFTGISFFILVPITALVLVFTIIGIPVAMLMMAVLCFVFLFYELIGTVIWSSWILDRYMKGKKDLWWRKLLVIFAFAVAFGIISGIDIIPAWMAIGALLTRHWRLLESIRK
ncbi:MAG: hypothetical protein PHH16_02055 [Candidatus Gracilibacteria bacterium]|nr:hypothetical protein [Candidatus Gracilibacteria bacterium]